MLLPGLIDGFLFERPCRRAAPKVQSLCGLCFRMTQLQQGFVGSEMGFWVKLHGSNPSPLMSALGQKQTSDWRPLMSALPPKRALLSAPRMSIKAGQIRSLVEPITVRNR